MSKASQTVTTIYNSSTVSIKHLVNWQHDWRSNYQSETTRTELCNRKRQ